MAMGVSGRKGVGPGEDVGLARETMLSPPTVGAIMRWLTDDAKVLVTLRGHGWTGSRVRSFDIAKLGLADRQREPESVTMTDSHIQARAEPQSVMASPHAVTVN